MSGESQLFSVEALRDFSAKVFLHFGVPEADAALASGVLATADLRGIDSHGVARLHTYFDMLTLGRINPKPTIRIVRESPSTATVDGDNGLGLVVGPKANEIAMAKAAEAGSGWVSVSNSNHYGIAGYYVLKALERDLIGDDQLHEARGAALGGRANVGNQPDRHRVPRPRGATDRHRSRHKRLRLWEDRDRKAPRREDPARLGNRPRRAQHGRSERADRGRRDASPWKLP